MKGTVYLLCDSGHDGLFKIGVTKGSVERRIKKLQTGNGNEIFLVNYHETDYPFFIEKSLHRKYQSDNQVGEWFELPHEAVLNFEKDCQFFEGIVETMKDNPFFKRALR